MVYKIGAYVQYNCPLHAVVVSRVESHSLGKHVIETNSLLRNLLGQTDRERKNSRVQVRKTGIEENLGVQLVEKECLT